MFTLKVDDALELALVQTSFAKHYLEIVQQERDYLSQWLPWPAHADNEQFFLNFIQRSLHDYADGKSLTCALVLQQHLVGNISFNHIHRELKKVQIGYWLSAKYQGQGIVTRAATKLIDMAFNDFGMEKIQISAATANKPSRNVCERLGLQLEGIITRAENLNGLIVDHAVYGLIHENWAKTNSLKSV